MIEYSYTNLIFIYTLYMYYQSIILVGNKKVIRKRIRNIATKLIKVQGEEYRNSPDYIEITEKEKKSIGIDLIRELIYRLQSKPYQSKNQLAVIKGAEKLTLQAQNSLLKILEEPPKKTQIILTSSHTANFLPTVLSRCKAVVLGNSQEDARSIFKEIDDIIDINDFLQKDILDKFAIISNLTKIKPPLKRESITNKLLLELYNEFSSKLKQTESNSFSDGEKFLNVLKLINQTHKKLKANTNYRLTLEHLVTQL
ncbi:hypothetical protein GF362_05245 [Candidatus Dojkabacteria bacterium]|nr:hypothetical protein [Candidatus Dojkabacteria bacterium]